MLDRLKSASSQLGGRAADTASKLASAAGTAATGATDATVRAAADQLRSVLETAVQEFRRGPLPMSGVILSASIGIGPIALQAQIVVLPDPAPGELEAPTHPAPSEER